MKKSIVDIPSVLRFWDYDKNDIDPRDVSIGSGIKRFWHCPTCGYRWKSSVKNVAKSKKCPCCELNRVIKKGVNDVLTRFPGLKQYVDFEKNLKEGIDIYSLRPYSAVKIWWKCPKCGKKTKSTIASRIHIDKDTGKVRYAGCRCDMGIYIPISTILPLMRFWDTDKNVNINPSKLPLYSNLAVWWRCPTCGFEWQTAVGSRIRGKKDGKFIITNCPQCGKLKQKKVADKTKMKKNREKLMEKYPYLEKYWAKENKKPFDAIYADQRSMYKWVCPDCGGTITGTISEIVAGKECCYCTGKKVLPGYNSLLVTRPDIAAIWSPANNRSPDSVMPSYARNVIWRCPRCKGEYKASVRDMVAGKVDCPYCTGKRPLPGFNTLSARVPWINKFYSDDNEKCADEILATSKNRIRIICPHCGGKYVTRPIDVLNGTTQCPHCHGSSTRTIAGLNSLADLYPDILKEWDFISNTILGLKPTKISKSSKADAWWICRKAHHRYRMTVANRINFYDRQQDACPICKGIIKNKRNFI